MNKEKNWVDLITSEIETRGTKTVISGGEGVGKTSTAAYLPDPVFMITAGEDSLGTLQSSGEIPRTLCFPPMENWMDIVEALRELVQFDKVPGTLVLDALDGFEALLVEYIKNRHFGGDRKTFTDFGHGMVMACDAWREFLAVLDELSKKGTNIILLAHTTIKLYNNPDGSDFDRWIPAASKGIWALTARWCDNIFMLSCIQNVEEDKRGKAKATGSNIRVMYTTPHPARVCKNRSGLDEQYILGASAKEAAGVITGALNL